MENKSENMKRGEKRKKEESGKKNAEKKNKM